MVCHREQMSGLDDVGRGDRITLKLNSQSHSSTDASGHVVTSRCSSMSLSHQVSISVSESRQICCCRTWVGKKQTSGRYRCESSSDGSRASAIC